VEHAQMDLEALVEEAAADLDECRASPLAGKEPGATYSRGGVDFAVRLPHALQLRLPADIAGVASGMPDVRDAGRPGWVELRPVAGDAHVADRARAWFVTAWRHAAGGR
jgi:hypothetical protein